MIGSTKRLGVAAAIAVGSSASRAICVHCLTLAGNQSFARTSRLPQLRRTNRRPAKSALNMDLDLDGAVDAIMSSSSNVFQSTSSVITSHPMLEAEILSDASSIAFDLSSILFSNTAWLRLCNVLGRVFILTSTYLQSGGANVSPDTALLQFSMLFVSIHLFLQSVGPQIIALLKSPSLSVRDRRVYSKLFDPAGVSALQYKTLLASRAIEWVDCHNSSTYLDLNGDFMYFRYIGAVAEDASRVREPTGRSQNFFGELQFARSLEERSKKRSVSKSDKMSPTSNSTLHAEQGSSLLRLSSSKILQLMENDDELSTAVPKLVLKSMQEKLIAPLEEMYDGSV